MSPNKLYTTLLVACFLGFGYFIYSLYYRHETVCFIKRTTNYPCPACGNTRAIILLTKGEILQSVLLNPFGIVVFFAMLFVPSWILFDLIKKQNSFYIFYKGTEKFLKNKSVAILLITLILANWAWNIYKNL